MSGEVNVTLIGTTGGPSELRFTPSGVAVCNFSMAVTPRRFDKLTNQWKDQPPQWYRVAVWRDQAEAVAETLTDKGVRVIVVGSLSPREYEAGGVKRMSLDVDAEEVAVSLRYATAKVNKTQRGGGGGGHSGGGQSAGYSGAGQQPQQGRTVQAQTLDDPWATGPSGGGGFGGGDKEPPF